MSDRYVGHVLRNVHVPGRGRIWLDDVVCPDSCHIDLSDCSHRGWGVHDCSHSHDVSIACYERTTTVSTTTTPTTTTAGKTKTQPSLRISKFF